MYYRIEEREEKPFLVYEFYAKNEIELMDRLNIAVTQNFDWDKEVADALSSVYITDKPLDYENGVATKTIINGKLVDRPQKEIDEEKIDFDKVIFEKFKGEVKNAFKPLFEALDYRVQKALAKPDRWTLIKALDADKEKYRNVIRNVPVKVSKHQDYWDDVVMRFLG